MYLKHIEKNMNSASNKSGMDLKGARGLENPDFYNKWFKQVGQTKTLPVQFKVNNYKQVNYKIL